MLSLENVKKSFVEPGGGLLPVLNVPKFQVATGEQMVLVGRSGSGKTTLLHLIAGIGRPDEGTIRIDNIDIVRLPEAGRDRFRADKIGYVFQTFNLLPGFTALENVLLGMSFSSGRVRPDRARQLLDRVGLSHRLDHKPAQLSVGEQQRVAVARALANQPKLLLADEPTANIDTRHQQQVIDLVRETCREENVALVLVTHTPQVAEQFNRVENLEEINRRNSEAKANYLATHEPSGKSPCVIGISSLYSPRSMTMSLWSFVSDGPRSMALMLGVSLVVAVLVMSGVVGTSFQNSAGLGYNMIVGAKGGALQLVFNTVYHIDKPIENIPYSYYKEFLPARSAATARMANSPSTANWRFLPAWAITSATSASLARTRTCSTIWNTLRARSTNLPRAAISSTTSSSPQSWDLKWQRR